MSLLLDRCDCVLLRYCSTCTLLLCQHSVTATVTSVTVTSVHAMLLCITELLILLYVHCAQCHYIHSVTCAFGNRGPTSSDAEVCIGTWQPEP